MLKWATAFVLICAPFVSLPFSCAAQNPVVTPPITPSVRLLLAVNSGDPDRVRQVLETGVDVNTPDALGGTPLMAAAWSGQGEIISLLLSHGADVNATHKEAGSTALEYAVLTGHTEAVRLLLAAGADVQRTYRYGQTVVHVAAARGFTPILGALLDAKALLDPVDNSGNTPLDEAVLHDRIDSARLLIANGADPRRIHPKDGRGVLHEAAMKSSSDMIAFLVSEGAKSGLADESGQTPLDIALAYKNARAVEAFLALGARLADARTAADQAMETATLKGQTELVSLLLKNGFDPNGPSPHGSTYLHDAALKNQAKVADLLITHGANLNATSPSGGTPLHDAALAGATDVINVLLNHGASIDAEDRESGATPLMVAAAMGRAGAVQVLLNRGANPARTDHRGRTALDRARQSDDPATMKLLQNGGPTS